jgi:hypothetical protein
MLVNFVFIQGLCVLGGALDLLTSSDLRAVLAQFAGRDAHFAGWLTGWLEIYNFFAVASSTSQES